MKPTNIKRMALYIALFAASVTGAVELLYTFSPIQRHIPLIAVTTLLVFVAVYIMIRFQLNDFIFQKINPLYKTIGNLKTEVNDQPKVAGREHVIEDLNREVEDWASGKTRELDQLREMEAYRREFLGNLSHEMKTPIFNIQGYIQSLLEEEFKDQVTCRKYLERAGKSLKRLSNIVSDLDVIAGLDSGEVKIQFEVFDIVELTGEVLELQEMRAQKQGVKLKLKNESYKRLLVHADRKRIQEVLINLLINSIKYSSSDGVTTVDFIDMDDQVLVQVEDNGIGIPNNELPRIFERFYRVDRSRSRNQEGTGLGLAIVKHVIEAHNQSVNVRSTENQGTCFSFTLNKGRNSSGLGD
jgi:two-component system, OmpR family, phosphate regulon sensor histidine kinase PhoR